MVKLSIIFFFLFIAFSNSNTQSQSLTSEYLTENVKSKVVVEPGVLNMRQTPDINSKIIHKLFKGAVLTVMETNGEWMKVMYQNQKGWVHSNFIRSQNRSVISFEPKNGEPIGQRAKKTVFTGESVSQLQINMSTSEIEKLFSEPDTVNQYYENINEQQIWSYNMHDNKMLYLIFINNHLISWQISNLQNIR